MLATAAPDAPPAAMRQVADNDIRIKDLEGREHSLTEWSGKILVVNFWATWCPPCVVEIPVFIQLQNELGSRGLQFVGIALDDPQAAGKFAQERGVNYPVLAGEDEVSQLMQGLGNQIGALPYTVVFGRDGQILHTHQGEWHESAARKVLEVALGAPSAQQAAR